MAPITGHLMTNCAHNCCPIPEQRPPMAPHMGGVPPSRWRWPAQVAPIPDRGRRVGVGARLVMSGVGVGGTERCRGSPPVCTHLPRMHCSLGTRQCTAPRLCTVSAPCHFSLSTYHGTCYLSFSARLLCPTRGVMGRNDRHGVCQGGRAGVPRANRWLLVVTTVLACGRAAETRDNTWETTRVTNRSGRVTLLTRKQLILLPD